MSRGGNIRRRRNPGTADRALTAIGVPRRNRTTWIVGGLLVLGVAAYFSPQAYNRITYGPKSGLDAPKGDYLHADPIVLASAAGVSPDTYSLARAIRSEAGSTKEAERIATGWVIKNQAARLGKSITATVTQGTKGSGFYGGQNLGGRYVSTAIAPLAKDLELAADIIDGNIEDNTYGAVRFFNPSLQDYLWKKAASKYTKNSEQVLAGWAADGYQASTVEGVDPDKFLVFRFVGKGNATSELIV